MPSPFPGMDPYLETPSLWPDVHANLITEIQGALNARLRPRYFARVELRVYIDDRDRGGRVIYPDVRVERGRDARPSQTATLPEISDYLVVSTLSDEEAEEAYLKILDLGGNLVTVIEVLSPANKRGGSEGRASFMAKRQEIMNTDVHWVEIDLLRAGTPSVTSPALPASDYRVLVSHAGDRLRTRLWPFGVRDPFPVVGIPLKGDEPDAPLDLGPVLRTIYDRAAYDITVDYSKPPDPPLCEADAAWAAALIRDHLAADDKG